MSRIIAILQRWRWGLAVLLCAGIAHIVFAMAMPHLFASNAYTRLNRSLPANTFVILPLAEPKAQVLPYQTPDVRYAMCRFDASGGPVIVTAKLPDPGWTFSIYTPNGEALYAFAAQQSTDMAIAILPPGERFVDVVGATQRLDLSLTQLHATTREGLVVIRAPVRGRTYAAEIERDLTTAQCKLIPY